MERLISPLSAAERTGMVSAARALVGVPFKHRGRSVRGVDCVGLVAVALASLGREVQDRRHYGRTPQNDGLREVLCAHFGDPVADMQAGDVVLMAVYAHNRDTHEANHVGLITAHPNGGHALLHSLAMNREVIEHRLDASWTDRIRGVWRP